MTKKWKISLPKDITCENDFYLIKNKKYFRVTRVKSIINQPTLNNWRMKLGEKEATKILIKRQEFGTMAHNIFERIAKGIYININDYANDELKDDIKLMYDFIGDCDIDTDATEQKLYSDKHCIAGTCDFIGKYTSNNKYLKRNINSKFNESSLVIGDWKTSSLIYKDYWIQLAAYVIMFEELTGIRVDGAFIALFHKNRLIIEEKTYDELLEYFEIMKHCIALFKYQIGA
jgi:hypothetical protein